MITRIVKVQPTEATREIRIDDFEFEQGCPKAIESYKKGLLNITSKHNLPIQLSNKFGEAGAWSCSNPSDIHVGIGYFWFDEENLAPVIAMCHELGHWYDANFVSPTHAHYYSNGTKVNEIRAWEYAVYFAKAIGFKEWDVLVRYAEVCLASYYRGGSLDFRDLKFGYVGTPPTHAEGVQRIWNKIKEVDKKCTN